MNKIKKAGCIVISRNNADKILLIYRGNQGDFSFPKGHVEDGEAFEFCAVREVKEETGLNVEIIGDFASIEYIDSSGREIICNYYVAISLDDLKICAERNCSVEWVDVDNVANKISYDNLRDFYLSNIDKLKTKKGLC